MPNLSRNSKAELVLLLKDISEQQGCTQDGVIRHHYEGKAVFVRAVLYTGPRSRIDTWAVERRIDAKEFLLDDEAYRAALAGLRSEVALLKTQRTAGHDVPKTKS